MRESETPEESFFAADFPELCGGQLTDFCADILEENNVVWLRTTSSVGISIEVDLLFVSQTWFPLLYDVHAMGKKATKQEYDKSEVLNDAIQSLLAMLTYFSYSLPKTPHRELEEALLMSFTRKGGIGLTIKDVRSMLKKYELKSKPGRKPITTDTIKRQTAIRLYDEVLEILAPGFDEGCSEQSKIGACLTAVKRYRSALNHAQGLAVKRLAEKAANRRSPESAALFLVGEMLKITERQVRRRLSIK